MKPPIVMPTIRAAQRTPLVETLLRLNEGLAQGVQKLRRRYRAPQR